MGSLETKIIWRIRNFRRRNNKRDLMFASQLTHKNIHNQFKLNGYHCSYKQLVIAANTYIKEAESEAERDLGIFLLDWLDDSSHIEVHTSGSTGIPKSIMIEKKAMIASALATGDFFNLKSGDSALLCLPVRYIAGKMMVVRAVVLGLSLDMVPPSTQPLKEVNKKYDFAAMIPIQIENSLSKINLLEKVIIGGAAVSHSLRQKILEMNVNAYETYGMTETITHIAAKKIGTKHFKTLPQINISQDERGCLVIHATRLSKDPIVTNDLVSLHSETKFEWLGRIDNVINSGGVKLFPEKIEAKLAPIIPNRFFVIGEKDEILGEQLVLVIEGKETRKMDWSASTELATFEKPKKVYYCQKFDETPTGKINRKETFQKIKKKEF